MTKTENLRNDLLEIADAESIEGVELHHCFRAATALEPTHYAVVDEQGEIIHARTISDEVDIRAGLYRFIDLCKREPDTRGEAEHWTVREVTVHE